VVAAIVELVVEAVLLAVVLAIVLEAPPVPAPDVLEPPGPLVEDEPAVPVVVPIVTFEPPPNASASRSSPFAHASEFAKKASPTRLNSKKRRI
jgi:hypothetical protein